MLDLVEVLREGSRDESKSKQQSSCEIRFLSQNVYPVPGTGYTFVYGYPAHQRGCRCMQQVNEILNFSVFMIYYFLFSFGMNLRVCMCSVNLELKKNEPCKCICPVPEHKALSFGETIRPSSAVFTMSS